MPLKTLIVGGGSIGERHLRCFQRLAGIEVALCELDARRRRHVCDAYGVTRTFDNFHEAADCSWDAAIICTPANLHVEQAVALLRHTPALFIEKPLSTADISAEPLLQSARGKVVGVAYTYRSHPAIQSVKEWIEDGELGRVLQLTIVTGSHFPTLRPAYRETYYARRETGGGAIQDAATHLFDLAHYLVGRFDWVFCDAARLALDGVDVEDTVHVIARANDEAIMISIAVNQFMAPFETIVHINGEAASAKCLLHEHRYGIFRHGDADWTWRQAPIRERDDLFTAQAAFFIDAIEGKRPVLCSITDAQHTLAVNIAALASAERGEKVRIEPCSIL